MLFLLLLGLFPQGEQPPPPPPVAHKLEKTYHIPYRLAETQHILVRARINGKGPFTFIMDTGAPQLFLAQDRARQLGLTADKASEATLDRVEIEGGAVLEKLQARIADPAQLIGMNALGLSDTQIAGVLGYNVLARFRIQLDLTQTKMLWTRLDYIPPDMATVSELTGGKPFEPSADYLAMEKMLKSLKSTRGPTPILPRGFFGIEFMEGAEYLQVRTVLPGTPAALGGMRPGDRITEAALEGKEAQKIETPTEAMKLLANVAPGENVIFTVKRGPQTRKIIVKAGKGGL